MTLSRPGLRTTRVWWLIWTIVLAAARRPSDCRDAGRSRPGPDQGLYAVRRRAHQLRARSPYRDAWDQKPPGIHYVYAGLRAVSRRDVVVPAAELAAAPPSHRMAARRARPRGGWRDRRAGMAGGDRVPAAVGSEPRPLRRRARARAGRDVHRPRRRRRRRARDRGRAAASGAGGCSCSRASFLCGVAFTLKYNAGDLSAAVLGAAALAMSGIEAQGSAPRAQVAIADLARGWPSATAGGLPCGCPWACRDLSGAACPISRCTAH